MKEVPEASIDRFTGLDVNKHYAVACAVNAREEVLLGPVRVDFARWPQPGDRVGGGGAGVAAGAAGGASAGRVE